MKLLRNQSAIWVSIILCLLAAACSGPESVDLVTAVAVSTPIPLPTRPATKTPPASPTNTPIPSLTPTPEPTSTPEATKTPTPQPTNTPTPVPTPLLTIRQPSLAELEMYLAGIVWEEFTFTRFTDDAALVYEDVSGDGEADLIVSDFLLVGVFVWQVDHYMEPFIYQGLRWKYAPGSRVYLEDWTNDDVPEVVFDYRQDTGGSGFIAKKWTKYVIYCADAPCRLVWVGDVAASTGDYNAGGLDFFQADLARAISDEGTVSLEIATRFFAIYTWGGYCAMPISEGHSYLCNDIQTRPDFYRPGSLTVLTSTLTSFAWNETQFEWQETEVLEPAYRVDSQQVLEATGSGGETAVVTAKFNGGPTWQNDTCQLFVNGTAVGDPFGCKQNFTTVAWQDLTNDGAEELVIIALSGLHNAKGILLTDKGCVHQRLLAYQWVDTQLTEIANITGCVVQSDLYGVKIQDVDADGQVEILAADSLLTPSSCEGDLDAPHDFNRNCWYEPGHRDEVYKWNGSEFVYWKLLSE